MLDKIVKDKEILRVYEEKRVNIDEVENTFKRIYDYAGEILGTRKRNQNKNRNKGK